MLQEFYLLLNLLNSLECLLPEIQDFLLEQVQLMQVVVHHLMLKQLEK